MLTYGIAVFAVALSIVAMSRFSLGGPVPTFLLAVIIATWFGGTRPGVFAAALSVLAIGYLYVSNPALIGHGSWLARLVYFLLIASFVIWIIASERSAAESLRRARDELRLVIDSIPAMAWILLPDGQMDFLNRRWLEYTGLSHEEGVVRGVETIHPDDRAGAVEKWRQAVTVRAPYEHEMRLRGAGGQYRWFLVRTVAQVDADGKILRWYGTSTDIEDRKCAEQALLESAERLQHLTHRLLEVQEQERRHLSRELHDEFGQILAAINLHLQAARNTAGDAATRDLEQPMALVQRAVDQVRNLALDLRPRMLETGGLDETLRWLADEHQQRTGIVTAIVGQVDAVDGSVAIACFRIAQEALTNAAKHAQAQRIWIELAQGSRMLDLTIRDDGRGFDVAATLEDASRRGRLGLLGMRERVQILGGRLDVESRPGGGTRIRAHVPFEARAPRAVDTAA